MTTPSVRATLALKRSAGMMVPLNMNYVPTWKTINCPIRRNCWCQCFCFLQLQRMICTIIPIWQHNWGFCILPFLLQSLLGKPRQQQCREETHLWLGCEQFDGWSSRYEKSHGSEVRCNQVEVGSLLQKHRVPFLFTSGGRLNFISWKKPLEVDIQDVVDIVNWYRIVFYQQHKYQRKHVCPLKNDPKAPPSWTMIQHIMKCDLVAEAFCPFWPLPNAACSRLKRLVKYDFLGAPQIFPWSTSGVKDPSWIITFTTCLWYTRKPPSKKVARFFVNGPQKTFAFPGDWSCLLWIFSDMIFPSMTNLQTCPSIFTAPFRGQHFARVVIVFWAGFETLRVPSMWKGGGDGSMLCRGCDEV